MDALRAFFRGRRGASLVIEAVAQATAAGMNPNIGKTANQLSRPGAEQQDDSVAAPQ